MGPLQSAGGGAKAELGSWMGSSGYNPTVDGGYSQPFGVALKIGGEKVSQMGRAWGSQPLCAERDAGQR